MPLHHTKSNGGTQPKAIVVDLDFTIADVSKRLKYAGGPEKINWDIFMSNQLQEWDEPYPNAAEYLQSKSKKYYIIYLTGRFASMRPGMAKWLDIHGFPDGLHILREPEERYIKSEIYKEKKLRQLMKEYDIVEFYDDEEKNCKMAESLGIKVYCVKEPKKFWESISWFDSCEQAWGFLYGKEGLRTLKKLEGIKRDVERKRGAVVTPESTLGQDILRTSEYVRRAKIYLSMFCKEKIPELRKWMPPSNPAKINLKDIKEYTDNLIKDSKLIYQKYPKKEYWGDYIDQSIISNIETINKNPDLATTGSCSGHDGHPFIALVFKDKSVRNKYLRLLKRKGYKYKKTAGLRMEWLKKWQVSEEWIIYKPSPGKEFWEDITPVLSIQRENTRLPKKLYRRKYPSVPEGVERFYLDVVRRIRKKIPISVVEQVQFERIKKIIKGIQMKEKETKQREIFERLKTMASAMPQTMTTLRTPASLFAEGFSDGKIIGCLLKEKKYPIRISKTSVNHWINHFLRYLSEKTYGKKLYYEDTSKSYREGFKEGMKVALSKSKRRLNMIDIRNPAVINLRDIWNVLTEEERKLAFTDFLEMEIDKGDVSYPELSLLSKQLFGPKVRFRPTGRNKMIKLYCKLKWDQMPVKMRNFFRKHKSIFKHFVRYQNPKLTPKQKKDIRFWTGWYIDAGYPRNVAVKLAYKQVLQRRENSVLLTVPHAYPHFVKGTHLMDFAAEPLANAIYLKLKRLEKSGYVVNPFTVQDIVIGGIAGAVGAFLALPLYAVQWYIYKEKLYPILKKAESKIKEMANHHNPVKIMVGDIDRTIIDLNRPHADETQWYVDLRKSVKIGDVVLDIHSYPEKGSREEKWQHYDVVILKVPEVTDCKLVSNIKTALNLRGFRVLITPAARWNWIQITAHKQGGRPVLIELNEKHLYSGKMGEIADGIIEGVLGARRKTEVPKNNPLTYEDYKEAVEGEGWAIGDYADMISKADSNKEKRILRHIRDEEREHMDELIELMGCKKARGNPIRSKAQWRFFKARHPELFEAWQKEHPVKYHELPERITKKVI